MCIAKRNRSILILCWSFAWPAGAMYQKPATRSHSLLVNLLIANALIFISSPVVAGQLVDFSAVPRTDNGASPAGPIVRIELEELWRAGGDNDDDFFGVIGDCLRDEAGNFYLLDRQLCEISVYSPTGKRLRTMSGQGEGPGEVDDPNDFLFMPDGSLGIVHRAPGEIVRLDPDGTPLSSYRLSNENGEPLGHVRLRQANVSGENLVICANKRRRSNKLSDHERFLSIFSGAGVEGLKLINNTKQGFDFEERSYTERYIYFVDRGGWTTDAAGRIYIAPERNQYLIQIFNPDGSPLRAITREFTSPLRSSEEKKKVEAGLTMTFNGEQVKLDADIEQRQQTISKLRVDSDGIIWVQHSRSKLDLDDGVFIRYDRFDLKGQFVDQVEIHCAGDSVQDQLHCLSGDYFILLRGITSAYDAYYAEFNAPEETTAEDDGDIEPLEVVCLRRK
ncbi:hypothetical protein ACFL6M_04905 [Candidatus Eisenbacteria bacterium]|uniref:6-bladed beta-propeller n=1 Tax=Eiseniibacteriota bacterium TaxID=2212470 RepID=A0ABV6YKQ7_UNCEI